MRGPHFVCRCVIDNDPAQRLFAHPFTVVKSQRMDRAVRAFYYHNYFQNTGGRNAGFGAINYLYWDSRAAGHNPNQLRFFNNIIDFPEALSRGGAAAPVVRGNVLRHRSNVGKLTANGGLHVGDDFDEFGLDDNLVPQPGSRVLGRGRPLDRDLVDSRSGGDANADAGPFKVGDRIDADWPPPGANDVHR